MMFHRKRPGLFKPSQKMLSLFRPNLRKSGIFNGFTDWHCHLLPGVDDGIAEMRDTLAVLARYEELGVREVWITPHIMEDYPNTPSTLQARYAELCAAWHGGVRLHLAAEHMLDGLFLQRLGRGELLPIGEARQHLLVETSYFNPPVGFRDILREVMAAGYHPLLAHPERYIYMDGEDYAELREMGVRFQLNLTSLVGMYGESVRKKARMLLKKGMYHATGTDLHRQGALETLLRKKAPRLELPQGL